MKLKKIMNLRLFDEGGTGGDGGQGNAGTGGSGQGGAASYTYEQLEEIANSRAERAGRSALADFFRKQGMDEAAITSAIADYKEKQKANKPDVSVIEKERDTYKQQVEQMKNEKLLTAKGVQAEDLDYVLFKVNALVDDKTDFTKAMEKFLKENPRYFGKTSYKVSASTGTETQGSGGSVNSSINDAIRAAARR